MLKISDILAARRMTLPATIAATLIVAAAVPIFGASAAADPCAPRETTAAFAPWGDKNQYFPVRNGDFESGSTGWTVINRVLAMWDNEPWRVLGWFDHVSARLEPGSTLTTATFCVAADEDSVRMFVRRPGVYGAKLIVTVTVSDGVNSADHAYAIDGQSFGWTPSARMNLPNVRQANGEQYVTISFRTTGTRASWSVDDVMVDPWKSAR